ncbi:unnamed protein product, partial [Prunus brigantina]
MSTKSQRCVNWRPEEDDALCKGWVSVSEDGAIDTNQASNTFWKCIYQKFLENDPSISGPKRRTYQVIASRFKTINQQCSLWKAGLTKANMNPQSGSNLHDMDMCAKMIFLNDNKPPNRPFKLYHAWEILKDCPKWNNINEPPTQHSSGASASMVNLDNDADDIIMPSPRLERQDKQKAAQTKTKRRGNAFEEDRRQKLNILDKFVQDQANAYAYHKQQDKEAQEQKIMSMDVSKFTPRKKKYWG